MPVKGAATQPSRRTAAISQAHARCRFQWFSGLSFIGRAVVITGALFALFCAFFAEENWRGRRAWDTCRRELEAKGVLLDWQKFVPSPVPDDQNFAMTPFLAPLFDFNPKPRQPGQTVWRDTEGHDRAINFAAVVLPTDNKGQLPPARLDGRLTDLEAAVLLLRGQSNKPSAATPAFATRPQVATALLTALGEYQPTIEELRVASRRPYSRFNVEYDTEDPFSILLPHYLVLQRVTRVLELRASAELALGQPPAAFEDVELMYYLSQSTSDEPFLISLQSRGSLVKRTEQIIWEGLAGRNWSESQLRQFQAWFAGFTVLKDLERGLQAERAGFGDAAFRYMRVNKNTLRNWMASDQAAGSLFYLLAGPRGWLYQEQVSYHRLYDQRIMTGFDADAGWLHPGIIEENRRALDRDLNRSPLWHHAGFSKLILPFLTKTFQRAAIVQNRANQTVMACALERCRLSKGKYPEKLDSLIPAFADKVLPDVCDGQPLKYRLLQDGYFLLYGVGWNEKDDDGLLVMNQDGSDIDPNQGDWLWPAYPEK